MRSIIKCATTAIVVSWLIVGLRPMTAQAQARLAVQPEVGVRVPLSASVHNAVRLDPRFQGGTNRIDIPTLSRRYNRVGIDVGASILFSNFEVGYSFARMQWSRAVRDCEGDRPTRRLPNGEVEDAEVRYDCDIPGQTIDLSATDDDPMTLHFITGGYRLRRAFGPRFALYGVGSGGIVLTTFRDNDPSPSLRVGAVLGGGGGVDFRIERFIVLTADVRYGLVLLGSSAPFSRSAARAVASDSTVFRAVLDPFHTMRSTIGVRIELR